QAPALLGNEARIKASGALGLVNPNLQSFRLPSSDLQVGVVDYKVARETSAFMPELYPHLCNYLIFYRLF
ncbi:MAG: hypothetical protein PHX60_15005, partial [Giesbergeria sp.]|uniref:hypothetical protein n=1 Tax=Giesbergeria sp. TaxID=2818473 RepID=UPI0026100250